MPSAPSGTAERGRNERGDHEGGDHEGGASSGPVRSSAGTADTTPPAARTTDTDRHSGTGAAPRRVAAADAVGGVSDRGCDSGAEHRRAAVADTAEGTSVPGDGSDAVHRWATAAGLADEASVPGDGSDAVRRPAVAAADPADEASVPGDDTAAARAGAHPTTFRTASDPAPGARPAPAPASDPGTSAARPAHAPRTPPVPRTMASPHRDGELRRTFPALPARPTAEAEGAGFAETWWGEAWLTALEEGALDAARLARGRGYAERGHVDAITVTPGLVLAYVQGSRPRPYRVQVRVRTLGDAEWARFLDAAADRPGHIAALLDKEMPQTLADCGVPLLPGPGDLEPHCSCPDRGHPCKHAAALCYQTARLLDADPFVLLLLRGRGERELLDALSRLSAARAARAAGDRRPDDLPGVRATEALAPRMLPPLPAPLPPPPHPEQPPAYPAAPGGPDPFALDQLATDAAARAHALLTTGRDPVGGLTLWQDAVRLAAARPGSGLTAATRALYASLAAATGRTPNELARAVAAWRQGGLAGLAVLEEPWDPPAGRFDRARPLLLAADLPAFRPHRNRLTHPGGRLQLRLGRDGLWYAYESEPGREDWWPRGTPDLDPVGALTALATPAGL
ncbi:MULTISPECIES: SWIM zinc finger family protein [unclassified Streptomyces]|uniref:SWIM zinc finger family protein n=1 Tax=unclassified Streptomyces TaxID=2593676 RepID=UPI001EF0BDAF|nr:MULTISPECIES: SWIM zinc finger family protein [unclassified Streptomyces]